MSRKALISVCCFFLLCISFADCTPTDQSGRLEKSCTLVDYFPLQVGNKWLFEIDTQYWKENYGFYTFYIRRGELSIEIVNTSSVNDSTLSYLTAEHFIGTEKRTFYIGDRSQSDTALVFDQIQQNEIREQIRGLYNNGSTTIDVNASHIVQYSNRSFNLSFGFFTERYKPDSTPDTLKRVVSSQIGSMVLKNIGPIYYSDLVGGQGASNRILVKLIKAEIQSSTTVPSQKREKIVSFQLVQNYPNPFNATTTIEFYQQKTGHVSLKIYSLMGQEMAHLLDESRAAGMHKITWDAGTLSSGVYYYVLESQGVKEIRKAILIK